MLSLNFNPNITIIEFRTSFSISFLYIYFRIENNAIKNESRLAELITKDAPYSFDISETMTIKEFEHRLSEIFNKKIELFYQKTGKRRSYVKFSDDKREMTLMEANDYAKSQGADNLETWVKPYHNVTVKNEKSQENKMANPDNLQNVNVDKEETLIIHRDKENVIGNTQSNFSTNNLLTQSLIKIEPTKDWKEYEAVIQVKNTLKPLKLNRDKDSNWARKQVLREEIIKRLINKDLPFIEGDVKNITIYFLAKPSVKITKQLIQSLLDSKSNFLYLGDERIIKDAKYYRSSELVNIGTMFLDCLKYKVILFKKN